MDRVVQQNAANAEESASASEEMNAQAEHMKKFVNDLILIIGGTVTASQGAPATRTIASGKPSRSRAIAKPAQAFPMTEGEHDF